MLPCFTASYLTDLGKVEVAQLSSHLSETLILSPHGPVDSERLRWHPYFQPSVSPRRAVAAAASSSRQPPVSCLLKKAALCHSHRCEGWSLVKHMFFFLSRQSMHTALCMPKLGKAHLIHGWQEKTNLFRPVQMVCEDKKIFPILFLSWLVLFLGRR